MRDYNNPQHVTLALGCATDVLVQGVDFDPDDDADLGTFRPQGDSAAGHARAIEVGTSGDVRVTTLDGNVRTLPCTAGRLYNVGAVRVHASGTTATGIVLFI